MLEELEEMQIQIEQSFQPYIEAELIAQCEMMRNIGLPMPSHCSKYEY